MTLHSTSEKFRLCSHIKDNAEQFSSLTACGAAKLLSRFTGRRVQDTTARNLCSAAGVTLQPSAKRAKVSRKIARLDSMDQRLYRVLRKLMSEDLEDRH